MHTLPKERIHIEYIANKGDGDAVELPFKITVVGNFKGDTTTEADTPVGERHTHNINKTNFHEVMEALQVGLNINVPNHLSARGNTTPTDDLHLKLQFNSLDDFTPDALVRNVPELNTLVKLRKLLTQWRQSTNAHKEHNLTKAIKQLLSSTGDHKEQAWAAN